MNWWLLLVSWFVYVCALIHRVGDIGWSHFKIVYGQIYVR